MTEHADTAINESQAATLAELIERRRDRRKPVIKSAKIIINQAGSVINCFVVDESPGGVQVDLGAMIELPATLTIQFSNGATYLARRSWAAGTKVGLQFTSTQLVSEETSARMRKINEVMHTQGLAAAMATLRGVRFLDNAELRRLAEDAEAATFRLEAMLRGD